MGGGRYCCVPHCAANSDRCKGLTFHKFPKDEAIKRQWIAKIRRDPGKLFQIKKWTVVCSRHFTGDSFAKYAKAKEFSERRLKKDAIPTRFDWNNSEGPKQRKPPLVRPPPTLPRAADPNVEQMKHFMDKTKGKQTTSKLGTASRSTTSKSTKKPVKDKSREELKDCRAFQGKQRLPRTSQEERTAFGNKNKLCMPAVRAAGQREKGGSGQQTSVSFTTKFPESTLNITPKVDGSDEGRVTKCSEKETCSVPAAPGCLEKKQSKYSLIQVVDRNSGIIVCSLAGQLATANSGVQPKIGEEAMEDVKDKRQTELRTQLLESLEKYRKSLHEAIDSYINTAVSEVKEWHGNSADQRQPYKDIEQMVETDLAYLAQKCADIHGIVHSYNQVQSIKEEPIVTGDEYSSNGERHCGEINEEVQILFTERWQMDMVPLKSEPVDPWAETIEKEELSVFGLESSNGEIESEDKKEAITEIDRLHMGKSFLKSEPVDTFADTMEMEEPTAHRVKTSSEVEGESGDEGKEIKEVERLPLGKASLKCEPINGCSETTETWESTASGFEKSRHLEDECRGMSEEITKRERLQMGKAWLKEEPVWG